MFILGMTIPKPTLDTSVVLAAADGERDSLEADELLCADELTELAPALATIVEPPDENRPAGTAEQHWKRLSEALERPCKPRLRGGQRVDRPNVSDGSKLDDDHLESHRVRSAVEKNLRELVVALELELIRRARDGEFDVALSWRVDFQLRRPLVDSDLAAFIASRERITPPGRWADPDNVNLPIDTWGNFNWTDTPGQCKWRGHVVTGGSRRRPSAGVIVEIASRRPRRRPSRSSSGPSEGSHSTVTTNSRTTAMRARRRAAFTRFPTRCAS